MAATGLQAATNALYAHFACAGLHPYISCIGNDTQETIHVYLVRKPRRHEKPIPETWMGFRVASKLAGRPCLRWGMK